MEPDVRWVILSESALIDQQSNNVSLINVVEQMSVPKVALGQTLIGGRLVATILWEAPSDDLSVQYRMVWRTPGGTEQELVSPQTSDFGKGKRHRTLWGIEKVTLGDRAGDYTVAVQAMLEGSWRDLSTTSVEVLVTE